MAVVAVVVFVDAALLARTPAASSWRAGWLVASLAAYAAVLMAGRRGDLGGRAVWAGVAATLVVAVILAPYGSKDMWTYAAYGRAVATYHQSPYLHVPAEHPDDRITKEMAPEWRHTRAEYGPVFVAIATTGMAVAGDSPALARAYFQGIAALALLAALVLLARAGATPAQLALVGLNPLVTVVIVNGGHNDLLVGLAVLGAVLLAARRRWRAAGLVIGLGACIKVTAIIVLVGLAAVAGRRAGLRAAVALASVGIGVMVIVYILAGGLAALSPVASAASLQSRASVWGVMQRALTGMRLWPPAVGLAVDSVLLRVVPWALTAAAEVWIILRLRRDTRTSVAISGVVLAYLATAPYVLPWYVGWLLPVLGLVAFELVAWAGVALIGALLLAYASGTGAIALPTLLGPMASPIAPLIELAVLAVVLRRDTKAIPAVGSPRP